MGETEHQMIISCYQMDSSTGTVLHVVELLQLGKEFPQEPPRQPRLLPRLYAALSPQNDRKASLLKIIPS